MSEQVPVVNPNFSSSSAASGQLDEVIRFNDLSDCKISIISEVSSNNSVTGVKSIVTPCYSSESAESIEKTELRSGAKEIHLERLQNCKISIIGQVKSNNSVTGADMESPRSGSGAGVANGCDRRLDLVEGTSTGKMAEAFIFPLVSVSISAFSAYVTFKNYRGSLLRDANSNMDQILADIYTIGVIMDEVGKLLVSMEKGFVATQQRTQDQHPQLTLLASLFKIQCVEVDSVNVFLGQATLNTFVSTVRAKFEKLMAKKTETKSTSSGTSAEIILDGTPVTDALFAQAISESARELTETLKLETVQQLAQKARERLAASWEKLLCIQHCLNDNAHWPDLNRLMPAQAPTHINITAPPTTGGSIH